MIDQKDNNVNKEIIQLMEKEGNKYNIPPEALIEIYHEEQRVVNMNLRQGVHTNIKEIIEKWADNRPRQTDQR